MGIALNMIVGPYEEPFLEAAILSAKDLCWDFVLVDTAPGNNPNRMVMENIIFKLPKYSKRVRIIDMPRGEDKDFSFAAARELARTNTESEWILRLDADEVLHEDNIEELKELVETASWNASIIEVGFYHFMIYPWLYQYIEPKQILFRKNFFVWQHGVHEILFPKKPGYQITRHDIKYHHYGYCRGQEEVFKRWQLYVEIDGRPDWYKGYNPSNIITDRIAVCQNFKGTHPKVVQKTLERMFGPPLFEIEEIPRFEEIGDKIGIVMSPSFSAREELIAVLGKKEYEYIAICTEKPDPETLLKMLEEFKDDIGAVKSKHIFLILRGIFFKIGLPHNLEDAILHEGYTIKEV